MDSKSMIWVVVAVLVVLVLASKSNTATNTAARRGGSPRPIAGPAPMGTTWAQQGPYAQTSNQTNAWDALDHGIDAVGKGFAAAVNAGLFNGDSGDGSSGDDSSYDGSYVNDLPYDG